MPSFLELHDDNPRRALSNFIGALHDFLDELVRRNRSPLDEPLFWPQLIGELRDIWPHEAQRFAPAARLVFDVSDQVLDDHGLSGPTLNYKLNLVKFWYERYLTSGKSVLRRLIETINDLLKSYLPAVRANEALAEIKDFIRNALLD